MKRLGGLFFILGWMALVGCNSKSATGPEAPATKADGQTSSEATPEAGKEAKAEIPASVRHAGFSYYGLAREGELKYSYSSTPSTQNVPPGPGVMTLSLKSATEKDATFNLVRVGFGMVDSEDTVRADEKGVYLTTTSKGEFGNPILELPADVKPGSTWDIKTSFKSGDQTAELASNLKAVKIESVTTKGGTFEALRVELNGTMKVGAGQNGILKGISWYVKDLGMVKQEMSQTVGKNSATVKYELAEKPNP